MKTKQQTPEQARLEALYAQFRVLRRAELRAFLLTLTEADLSALIAMENEREPLT